MTPFDLFIWVIASLGCALLAALVAALIIVIIRAVLATDIGQGKKTPANQVKAAKR